MTRTIRHTDEHIGTVKRLHTRSQARKLVKDFERQYVALNKDPHIYL